MQEIPVGFKHVKEYTVTENDSPRFLLEKNIGVLSTPRMIALMEETCKSLLDRFLDTENYTSVGVHVDVHHKAPAPVGSRVVFIAEVVGVDGRRIKFNVKCLLGEKTVGEGVHERAIVSWEKFAAIVHKMTSEQ